MNRYLAFALLTLPLGCTQFPELDQATRQDAALPLPYPVILPLDGLLAQATGRDTTAEQALAARAAALRARAAALRAAP